jgi:hypothetical protein
MSGHTAAVTAWLAVALGLIGLAVYGLVVQHDAGPLLGLGIATVLSAAVIIACERYV